MKKGEENIERDTRARAQHLCNAKETISATHNSHARVTRCEAHGLRSIGNVIHHPRAEETVLIAMHRRLTLSHAPLVVGKDGNGTTGRSGEL